MINYIVTPNYYYKIIVYQITKKNSIYCYKYRIYTPFIENSYNDQNQADSQLIYDNPSKNYVQY